MPLKEEIMESTLVRRDQFNITPQGIVHKPTAAAFTPYPGDPYSGMTRKGQLSNKHPNGIGFSAEDVERMMRELWVEYVTSNPTLFKTAEPGCAEPGPAELNWSNPQAETPRTGVLLLMETPKLTAPPCAHVLRFATLASKIAGRSFNSLG